MLDNQWTEIIAKWGSICCNKNMPKKQLKYLFLKP